MKVQAKRVYAEGICKKSIYAQARYPLDEDEGRRVCVGTLTRELLHNKKTAKRKTCV